MMENFRYHRLLIQGLRAGSYLLILILALMMHLSQPGFLNWNLYWQFYLIVILGLSLALPGIIFLDWFYKHLPILNLTFFVDTLLISILLWKSELSISLFLFLYIFQILLSGLIFQTKGAFLLSAWTSLCFSYLSLIGAEIKGMSFFFSLVLYNIAFYAVAWISGLLSEQLEAQGVSLNYLRALNESIVETIPSGLLTVRSDGEIISANTGASELFKKTDIERANLRTILPELANLLERVKTHNIDENLQKKIEIPLKREGDNLILSVQILPHQTEPENFLIVLEDVTEVRRLELTLMHQQKLAAIGGLASGIAHELGNPLAAVSANIQYLEPKIRIDDETDKKLIANTHREISRLGRLIGEFKDFAKPEKIPVDPIRLDILLKQVLDLVSKDQSLRKDVLVRTDLSEVAQIRGSKDKLTQGFLNVIINAYQAVLDVEKPELQVSCKSIGLEVLVRISDNGVGMSEETKSRLFEPFYTTKGHKGTGLGLAITYKIFQAHNAKVNVESAKGRGTEFIFRFPVKS